MCPHTDSELVEQRTIWRADNPLLLEIRWCRLCGVLFAAPAIEAPLQPTAAPSGG